MARTTRITLSLALSALLAFGTIPAPALAEMTEEAATPVATSQEKPTDKPAATPAAPETSAAPETPTEPETPAPAATPAAPVEPETPAEPAEPAEPSETPASDPSALLPSAELVEAPAEGVAAPSDANGQSDALGVDGSSLSTQGIGIYFYWGTCRCVLDDGVLTVNPGTGATPVHKCESPWIDYADEITRVVFKSQGSSKVVLPSDSRSLFDGFHNLTSVDFSGADTSSVTNMRYMFYNCTSLGSVIGLSGFRTGSVTDMGYMFCNCPLLVSVNDLSGWDTSSVTCMEYMFYGCSSLNYLNLSGWNTWSVTDGNSCLQMFGACSPSVIKVGANYRMLGDYMFPDPKTGQQWRSQATGQYYGSSAIMSGRSGVADTYTQGDASGVTTGVWGTCSWDIDDKGVLTVHPGTGVDNNNTTTSPWANYAGQITSIRFVEENGQKVVLPSRSISLFFGLENATTIDLAGADTSSVTNMACMFYNCSSLTSVRGTSDWDTSSVLGMGGMFYKCSSLTSVEGLSDWDTSSVTNMLAMFSGCSSMTFRDGPSWGNPHDTSIEIEWNTISGWDTSSVSNMGQMFYGCTSAVSLSLYGWDTSSVSNMSYMFANCTSLVAVDIYGWDTSNVQNSENMFDNCPSLYRICIGGDYAMNSRDEFPQEPEGYCWYGLWSGQRYSGDEIVNERYGEEDEYFLMRIAAGSVTPLATSLGGTDWSAVYDPEWYASENPDVANWARRPDGYIDGNKLLQHFVNNGRREGRVSTRDFYLQSYYNANPDLRRAFGTDWARYYDHYRTNGEREERECTGIVQLQEPVTSRDGVNWAPVYDAFVYAWRNPDVAVWATRKFASGSVLDDAALLQHFVNNGAKEARVSESEFDVRSYFNANPDLRTAFGGSADWSRYYRHYATNGQREGRRCMGASELVGAVNVLSGTNWSAVYDRWTYAQKNADVARWATRRCGSATVLDDYALLQHFVNNGRKEGRASKATFELASYYNANPDLRRVFGTDWARYYEHYRANGQREGRRCAGVGQLQGAPTTAENVNWAPVYDANYYAQRNPDVANWARRSFSSGSVLDDAALLSHFVNSGTKEARASKSSFNVRAYRNKNADLDRAFGNDWKSYYRHYAKFGVNEHRACA